MKRLSISLIAVVAIIFAVGSAFTTSESTTFSIVYFANSTKATPVPVYDLDVTAAVNGMTGPSQAQKEAQYAALHCPSPSTPVCFAKFDDAEEIEPGEELTIINGSFRP